MLLIDKGLWSELIANLGKVSMPRDAHQQVIGILGQVEQIAQKRYQESAVEKEKP